MEETGGNNNNDDDKSTTGLNMRLQISLFNAAQDDLNDSFEKVIEDKDLSVSRLNHLNFFNVPFSSGSFACRPLLAGFPLYLGWLHSKPLLKIIRLGLN